MPTVTKLLDPRAYCGVIDHEPTELVITACSGTPLAEVESVLARHNQMLAFEPPHFGPSATLGGAIACGLAGPRRMAAGAIRDFVLGATLLDGRADVLTFGGNVMKNVAGYDVSRALAGSLGTLGMILDVSLKVLPLPAAEQTLRFELPEADAVRRTNEWAGQPWPISATAWCGRCSDGALVRSNRWRASRAAKAGRRCVTEGAASGRRFESTRMCSSIAPIRTLWRLSVPPTTVPLDLGATLIEWRGAQRWLWSSAPAADIRAKVQAAGGHATAFRQHDRNDVFHPLAPALAQIHQRLKKEFDPMGIFNPGRMYSDS